MLLFVIEIIYDKNLSLWISDWSTCTGCSGCSGCSGLNPPLLVLICLRKLGFCGSYAADVGLRPTAGFLGFYPSTHLPTYERMDS